MKKILFILTLALLPAWASSAFALSSYLSSFNTTYGTSGTVLNTCGLCHINPAGGGTRNAYGTAYANAGHSFSAIEALDSDGDGFSNITEINARTFPGDATSHPAVTATDTTAPSVSAFTIPSTSSSLTVSISSFAASDNVGVTGYLVNESSTKPAASATGWTATPPASYTFASAGAKTLYAWAKDAAGNVSASRSASVTITVATTGTISGTVKDIVTGAAVSGAVINDGGGHTAISSSSGSFSIRENAGSYTLTISRSGYLTTTQKAVVSAGAGAVVNWSLTKTYGSQAIPAANMKYTILAWNDLGMHCDQDDYSHFCVLPPYNTLHAQVFTHGSGRPVTSGVTVSYSFPKKTDSTLHTNFWKYAKQYGWNVPANVGISGTPLKGNMQLDPKGIGWVAVGIPITPYDDDGTWDPYGIAVITVKDSSGAVLQTVNAVAPVSTEMMCANCHGAVDTQLNILQMHDAYNGTTLTLDQANGKVHLCAECHQSNALGAPGKAGIESLSLAMHNFHKDKMSTTPVAAAMTPDCYNCHPGPKTQCMRGIMFRAGKSCHDCHGDMNAMTASLQNGRQAWLDEPQCGTCHASKYSENANTLYRNSVLQNGPEDDMNNRIYCEACHNSTHGEYTSSNAADTSVTMKFQGDTYWIWNCKVCHSGGDDYGQRSMHR